MSELRDYRVVDHGGFVSATGYEGYILLRFIARRFAGRSAADQRSLWREVIDAVSLHCGLWRSRVIEASTCPFRCPSDTHSDEAENGESDDRTVHNPERSSRETSASCSRQTNAVVSHFTSCASDGAGWRLSFAIHMNSGYTRSFGHHQDFDHPLITSTSLYYRVYSFRASRAIGIIKGTWPAGDDQSSFTSDRRESDELLMDNIQNSEANANVSVRTTNELRYYSHLGSDVSIMVANPLTYATEALLNDVLFSHRNPLSRRILHRMQPVYALTDKYGKSLTPLLLRLIRRRFAVSWRDR